MSAIFSQQILSDKLLLLVEQKNNFSDKFKL